MNTLTSCLAAAHAATTIWLPAERALHADQAASGTPAGGTGFGTCSAQQSSATKHSPPPSQQNAMLSAEHSDTGGGGGGGVL